MGSSGKHLKEQHHIHYPSFHGQARHEDPSIHSTWSPPAHFAYLYGSHSGHTCNEEHHPPHTAKASLAECSWLEKSRGFARHPLNVFPESNYQKRARLLRRGTPGHIYTPQYSLEKCPDSQELMDSTGGLPAVGTVGKGTGQGTAVCLIYCV